MESILEVILKSSLHCTNPDMRAQFEQERVKAPPAQYKVPVVEVRISDPDNLGSEENRSTAAMSTDRLDSRHADPLVISEIVPDRSENWPRYMLRICVLFLAGYLATQLVYQLLQLLLNPGKYGHIVMVPYWLGRYWRLDRGTYCSTVLGVLIATNDIIPDPSKPWLRYIHRICWHCAIGWFGSWLLIDELVSSILFYTTSQGTDGYDPFLAYGAFLQSCCWNVAVGLLVAFYNEITSLLSPAGSDKRRGTECT
ncbi:uncharacterized protein AB675_3598 [Cyphellophora attinorum]|uniref:Uncharacterized protein n=1 Tax=Cyphellophora attinorum TaxID=1664694 RepID=A0A0N0NJN6_9EURO|nr:uncharacterized protein AB675_3598 [Phialophora attinorum]KPI37098.1 hypothetical protein AB675_3598 [Phialophora attinorum]